MGRSPRPDALHADQPAGLDPLSAALSSQADTATAGSTGGVSVALEAAAAEAGEPGRAAGGPAGPAGPELAPVEGAGPVEDAGPELAPSEGAGPVEDAGPELAPSEGAGPVEGARPVEGAGPVEEDARMRSQVMSGLRFIGRHRYLANIAASTATSNLFSNIAFAIFPVYLYRTLGLSPETVGAIGGIGGAGVLVGALLSSRAASAFGLGPTIVGSILLGGIAELLVPIAPQDGGAFWFLAVSFFLVSVTGVIYNVNQVSLRQAITPERFLGRMNASMRFLVWGTIPIGSLIGAGLSEVIGVHNTIWIGSILGVFAFLPVFLSPVRSLRTIPADDSVTDPGR